MSEPSALPPLTPWQEVAGGAAFFLATLWAIIRNGPKLLPRVFGEERRNEPRGPLLKRVEAIEEKMREQAERLTKVETETSYLRTDVHRLEGTVHDTRKEISGKIDDIQKLLLQHFVNVNGR